MKIKFTLQLLLGLTLLGTGSSVSAENWPTWRGPQANGVAPGGNPPTEFSEEKNVQWKIKVPGSGSSTPVVWEDQVFILTAVATGKKVAAPEGGSSADRGSRSTQRGPRPEGRGGERPPGRSDRGERSERGDREGRGGFGGGGFNLSLIHISEPTRRRGISYAVFCLKKKIN